MEIITWNNLDPKQVADALDDVFTVQQTLHAVDNGLMEADKFPTEVAIMACKQMLMGEYQALLVRHREESLEDSEVYVITWQGEASEHGEMYRLDVEALYDIVNDFEKLKGTAE